MSEVTLVPKKIGGSLAIFLPADLVRKQRLREGVPVKVSIEAGDRAQAFGVLKGKQRFEPFDRHAEGWWPNE